MDQAPTDQLLECLLRLCELQGRPASKALLCDGLPLHNGTLGLDSVAEASHKVGLRSDILKRSHTELLHLKPPFILVGENNQACVITKINRTHAVIEKPNTEGSTELQRSELTRYYSDYVVTTSIISNHNPELSNTAPSTAMVAKRDPDESQTNKGHRSRSVSRWYIKHLPTTKGLVKPLILAHSISILCAILSILVAGAFIDSSLQHSQVSTLQSHSIGLLILLLGYAIFSQLAALFRRKLEYVVGTAQDETLLRQAFASPLPNNALSAHAIEQKKLSNFRFFVLHHGIPLQLALLFSPLSLLLIFFLGSYLVFAAIGAIAILLSYFLIIELPIRHQSDQNAAIIKRKIHSEKGLGIAAETIKANGATSYLRSTIISARYADSDFKAKAQRFHDINKQLSTVVIFGTLVLLSYIGGLQVLSQQITIGSLLSIIGLSFAALLPFRQLLALLPKIASARNFIEKHQTIAEQSNAAKPAEKSATQKRKPTTAPEVETEAKTEIDTAAQTTFHPNIRFKDVDFHYPENPAPVLRNISFKIAKGEKVAIIGNSGSGKSAVLKLIAGLYSPSTGEVLLSGRHSENAAKFFKGEIAYAPQQSLLVPGTVADNLILGQHGQTEEALQKAAKLSGVADFIQLHSKGYQSTLDSWGGFSEGQRQQILLCRALAGENELWLLDEPTQGIDAGAESKLIARLKSESKDKTIIITTHKPALLALVDRVIIMDNGRIIANGPKNDVLQNLKRATKKPNNTDKPDTQNTSSKPESELGKAEASND